MKHIRKLIILGFLFFIKSALGQNIPGFNNSNYAGISGVDLQPASIADMRYKFDMTLVGVGFSLNNNYIGVNSSDVLNGSIFKPYNDDFRKHFLNENTSSGNKAIALDQTLQLPSFAFSINKNISVGFSARERFIFNIDQLTPAMAHLAYTGLNNNDPQNIGYYNAPPLNGDGFNVNEMAWMEYSLHYAQVIKSSGPNFFKVGGSLKFEEGVEAAYAYGENLTYHWKNSDYLSLFSSHIGYGQTQSTSDIVNNMINHKYNSVNSVINTFTTPAGSSVAVDIGAVYEWRPGFSNFLYDMDGKTNIERRDKNKYKLKIGASILDLGSVQFNKGNNTYDFYADTLNWNVHGTKVGRNPVLGVDSIIRKAFPVHNNNNKTFIYTLPTTFSVQVDYDIYKDLYVNFTSYTSPRWLNVESQVSTVSYYSITPRWDSRWAGIFLPFSINEYGQAIMGAAVRLGPLVVGSTQILSALVSNNVYGMDVYAAIKIPIFCRRPPRDRDGDGVSDRYDKCPDKKGTWAHHGCPDTDGDGVYDDVDQCPTVPGPVENHGCPYPDTDGDGIPDNLDSCPKVAGPKENHGCPWGDADGDGVPDNLDSCKFIKGPAANHGCPYGDADNDGVPDNLDSCPHVAGPASNHGCPYGDADGDGVPDNLDSCPHTPGPASNHGCPVIPKSQQQVVNTAFNNLEFELNKAVIKASSKPSLDQLAKLMKDHPKFKLRISGYTDNVGTDEANLILSKERARAVKTALYLRGVNQSRLILEYHGSANPIAPNTTEAGRAKNRRVEMKIIFD